jgi:hypothetical protein
MKYLVLLALAIMGVLGCEKHETLDSGNDDGEEIPTDTLSPRSCDSITFTTDYEVQPGKIPPFSYTKTLYPDSTVKTIRIMSRAIPDYNHSMYEYGLLAYETIGTFTYSQNAAIFTGTTELWKYYTDSTGATGRNSVYKWNNVYNFSFNSSGYCTLMTEGNSPILELEYDNPGLPNTLSGLTIYHPLDEHYEKYNFDIDSIGNPLRIIDNGNVYAYAVSFKYDYSRSGDRYNYSPTEYAISQEYSLLEVMQWVPTSKNPRTSVAVHFLGIDSSGNPESSGGFYEVTQQQNYKNHIYDSNKNLVSYTYDDNVLQKTTWFCK